MHPLHGLGSGDVVLGLIEGVLLLLLGRRLFWLFVAIIGFVVVYDYFLHALPSVEPTVRIVVAAVAGLVGALLAILVQKLAAAVAGFLVGVYVTAGWLGISTAHLSGPHALELLVAGVIGALLALFLFDPALVALSSLAGASLIVDALHLVGQTRMLVWAVLLVVGIVVQMRLAPSRRRA